jgi:HJR/Mrr/RecB family endonuclease
MFENPEEASEDGEDEGEMPWEAAARAAIRDAVEDVERDEVRGAIYLMSGHDHHWDTVREEFRDAESIQNKLTQLGEGEWINHAPFDGGEPVFEPDVEDLVSDAIAEIGAEEFFRSIAQPTESRDAEEIVSADTLLQQGAGLALQVDVIDINEELVRYFARHPEEMRDMNPRKFEELVAELFKDKGYEMELTPRSKDGGLDIRAYSKSSLGSFLTLVECKRYAEKQRVGVQIVRQLYGVVNMQNATSGLIVTTSFFTKNAKSEQQTIKHRMDLHDFEELKDMLASYRSGH